MLHTRPPQIHKKLRAVQVAPIRVPERDLYNSRGLSRAKPPDLAVRAPADPEGVAPASASFPVGPLQGPDRSMRRPGVSRGATPGYYNYPLRGILADVSGVF